MNGGGSSIQSNQNKIFQCLSHLKCCEASVAAAAPCTCDPETRISVIKHLLGGCMLDASTRNALVCEIQKIDKKCTDK